jgi:hypothetical protein
LLTTVFNQEARNTNYPLRLGIFYCPPSPVSRDAAHRDACCTDFQIQWLPLAWLQAPS